MTFVLDEGPCFILFVESCFALLLRRPTHSKRCAARRLILVSTRSSQAASYPRRRTRSERCTTRLTTFVLDDGSCFILFVGHSYVLDQRTRLDRVLRATRVSYRLKLPTPPTDAQRTVRRAPVEVTIDGEPSNFRSTRRIVLHSFSRPLVRSGSAD